MCCEFRLIIDFYNRYEIIFTAHYDLCDIPYCIIITHDALWSVWHPLLHYYHTRRTMTCVCIIITHGAQRSVWHPLLHYYTGSLLYGTREHVRWYPIIRGSVGMALTSVVVTSELELRVKQCWVWYRRFFTYSEFIQNEVISCYREVVSILIAWSSLF